MLVAGGLGERLGYSGIKIALPTDLARGACFLQVLPLGLLTLPSRTICSMSNNHVCTASTTG